MGGAWITPNHSQLNNSNKSSQLPRHLNMQATSVDNIGGHNNVHASGSNKKIMGSASDLNVSQYTSTHRLNDSASGFHSNSNNVIKFSSEYGTYNTVQIGEEMLLNAANSCASGYNDRRCDSLDQKSRKPATMTASGIVSPEIQIQSTAEQPKEQVPEIQPSRLLEMSSSVRGLRQVNDQMPYGSTSKVSVEQLAAHAASRSGQNSVQAVRGMINGAINGLSPPTAKKRNLKGQISQTLNKTTSTSEAKRLTQKGQPGGVHSSTSLKTKGFYKNTLKPQSFVENKSQNSDAQKMQHHTRSLRNYSGANARFNSHTPRNIISPDPNNQQNTNQMGLPRTLKTYHQKQTTQEHAKQEQQQNNRTVQQVARLAASCLMQEQTTPKTKAKDGRANLRQKSLKEKEQERIQARFKTDLTLNLGAIGMMKGLPNQSTPQNNKMVSSSRAFATCSDSKTVKELSPSSKHQQKNNTRSRNAEAGKQTIDNHHLKTNKKWIEETHLTLSLQKKDNSEPVGSGILQPKRFATSKTASKDPNAVAQFQFAQRDTEDNENFDMKDLDEREPCQTNPSLDFVSLGCSEHTNLHQKMKIPLTTRSTHSLALNQVKRQVGQDLNLTSPAQLEDSQTAVQGRQQLGLYTSRQQTQPQMVYRNENDKLQGRSPVKPHYSVSNFNTAGADNLSGDGCGSQQDMPNDEVQQFSTLGQHTGSGPNKELGKKMQQTQPIKDFFFSEQFVIKEEKHRKDKKNQAGNAGNASKATGITSQPRTGTSGTGLSKQNSGQQLSVMARDFTIQNTATLLKHTSGVGANSNKGLNLPPKPSRNAKSNTLVLGSSQGGASMAAQMRSVQSIMQGKSKHLNAGQHGLMMVPQSTVVMTPKRDQLTSNNFFKGLNHIRSKNDKSGSTVAQQIAKGGSNQKDAKGHGKTHGKKSDKAVLASGKIRQSLGSPPTKKAESSAKKVQKVSSQNELLGSQLQQQAQQYSMSVLQSSSQPATQMTNVGYKDSIQDSQANQHLYLSLTKERRHTGNGTAMREKSQSSDAYQSKHIRGASHGSEHNTDQAYGRGQLPYDLHSNKKGQRNLQFQEDGGIGAFSRDNDYEIVFDHLKEDSIPDHPSYDMEEQPTVVLVDDCSQLETQLLQHHQISHPQRTSKERNASLLNASALARDIQFAHPLTRSIEPVPSSYRSQQQHDVLDTRKITGNAIRDNDPSSKIGSTDSKLFRQSMGINAATIVKAQSPLNMTSSVTGFMQTGPAHTMTANTRATKASVKHSGSTVKESLMAHVAPHSSQQQLGKYAQNEQTKKSATQKNKNGRGGLKAHLDSGLVGRASSNIQSNVASQASLHPHIAALAHAKQTSQQSNLRRQQTNVAPSKVVVPLNQRATSAIEAGLGGPAQQLSSNKKTMKKSMIKQ